MKEITTNKGTFLFVEVHDDSHNFKISHWSDNSTTLEFFSETYEMEYDSTSIDSDSNKETEHKEMHLSFDKTNYQIISTTKDITEEQAESVVEKSITDGSDIFGIGCIYFVDYTNKNNALFENSKESIQSLIQANGLDVNKNYLILLKK